MDYVVRHRLGGRMPFSLAGFLCTSSHAVKLGISRHRRSASPLLSAHPQHAYTHKGHSPPVRPRPNQPTLQHAWFDTNKITQNVIGYSALKLHSLAGGIGAQFFLSSGDAHRQHTSCTVNAAYPSTVQHKPTLINRAVAGIHTHTKVATSQNSTREWTSATQRARLRRQVPQQARRRPGTADGPRRASSAAHARWPAAKAFFDGRSDLRALLCGTSTNRIGPGLPRPRKKITLSRG